MISRGSSQNPLLPRTTTPDVNDTYRTDEHGFAMYTIRRT